jgi:hypothetical protein
MAENAVLENHNITIQARCFETMSITKDLSKLQKRSKLCAHPDCDGQGNNRKGTWHFSLVFKEECFCTILIEALTIYVFKERLHVQSI